MDNDRIIFKELSYQINGVLFYVHNELGSYCNEQQYCDAIEKQFQQKKIVCEREKILSPSFEGEENRNKIDFLIDNKIIVEIKAKRLVTREDYYQVRRYLKALKLKLGIIVNFRDRYLHPKRILNSLA